MGTPNVYRTGRSVIFESLTGNEIGATVMPEYQDSFVRLGLGSFAIVPIMLGETVIGTLGIGSMGHGKRYTAAELTILEQLAMRAALAMENARVYEREHRVAFELQKAALPSSLPDVPGFALDSVYEAGRSEALIGGDWYDAVRLPDGRTVISIGDVAGSGIAAAVTMANMRQVIRGTALAYGDPWIVLETADRALRADDPGRFVTAFVGVLDPVTETLTYASAGHPMPLVRKADGNVYELPGPVGAPLGLRTGRAETAPPTVLEPGSLIVLYTDGLIEATRDIAAGEVKLREAVAALAPDADAPAAALRSSVLGDGGAPDDVALLTVRVRGGAKVRRWSFASDDAAAAQAARLEIIAMLREAGATPEQVVDTEVIFSELVANVVRHAPGIVEAALDFSAPSPVLHVLDRGKPGATDRDEVDSLLESGRGLFIASRLARDVWVSPRLDGGSHARAALDVGPMCRSL
jgi:serine phosphatase RsbU (regulator of sigma subunit)/anti-sigma regulatory factor (Ser/Thr protein kinase)